MSIDWILCGVLLILGGGGGYVLGNRVGQSQMAGLKRQLEERVKIQTNAHKNWKDFCGCLAPVFPVFVGQLKAVVQETEQAASGLIQQFQKISQQAHEQTSSTTSEIWAVVLTASCITVTVFTVTFAVCVT